MREIVAYQQWLNDEAHPIIQMRAQKILGDEQNQDEL